jgi:hypothetical protein
MAYTAAGPDRNILITANMPTAAGAGAGAVLIDSANNVLRSDGSQWLTLREGDPKPAPPNTPPTTDPTRPRLPGDILDLSSWKLGEPRSATGDTKGVAREIKQPALRRYTSDWFHANADGTGVVFRADCGGATTKGSSYPRCELRGMSPDGQTQSSFGINDGKLHVLRATVSIDALPLRKPQVVIGQIHNPTDDVLELVADGFWPFTGTTAVGGTDVKPFALRYRFMGETDITTPLLPEYALGQHVSYRIETGRGAILLFADLGDAEPTTLRKKITSGWPSADSVTGCYLKCGCYVQANISNPGKTAPHRTASGGAELTSPKAGALLGGDATGSIGQVTVYALEQTHN